MGIKQLMNIINEKSSKAVRKVTLDSYFGKIIACDASTAMYQFLIATQNSSHHNFLTDESGNLTSHLMGIYYRTIQFLDNGIKPIWVLDGTAPELKLSELKRRKTNKFQARNKILAQGKNSLNPENAEEPKNNENPEEEGKMPVEEIIMPEEVKKIPEEEKKKPKKNKKNEEKKNFGKQEKQEIQEKEKKVDENNEEPEKNETNEQSEKKIKKKLSRRQWQMIQKKNYGPELDEIENSLRARINEIVGEPIGEICGMDYMCFGESDEEDVGMTKQLEQIVTCMENNGCSKL